MVLTYPTFALLLASQHTALKFHKLIHIVGMRHAYSDTVAAISNLPLQQSQLPVNCTPLYLLYHVSSLCLVICLMYVACASVCDRVPLAVFQLIAAEDRAQIMCRLQPPA